MSAAATFQKNQSVLVSYGVVQIMQAVGSFAKGGRIFGLKHRRRGWYEVAIGWDVETSTPIVVTAHASALTAI